jgi:N6-adenosine-specific RNA methylase IME4
VSAATDVVEQPVTAPRDGALVWLELSTISGTEFNRDPGDLSGLKRSIVENGLITPLACTPAGKLLAGRRRFAVLRELGWPKAPFIVIQPRDEGHAYKIMLEENTERKPVTDPEYAGLIEQYKSICQLRVETMCAAHIRETDDETKPYFSQEMVAAELGIDRSTVARALQVAEIVKEHPEWAHLKGKQILREAKLEDQITGLERVDRPKGEFDVIVCDPPWPYDGEYDPDHQREAPPYPTMDIEDIMGLKMPAASDCVLWLWTINRLLDRAFEVARTWGFEPKTVLTWAKDRFGTGRWLRGQTEHCILAIKGSPPWRLTNQSTLLNGPLREHSRKPGELYALVDSLCFGRKLDMFSREKRDGWEQWGDEKDAF